MPNKTYTQKEISKMSGLSQKTVWSALKRPQDVKKSTLEKIEQVLGEPIVPDAYRVHSSASLATPIEKWADELGKVCTRYSGEDWGFEFKAVEDGFEFKGFINIETQKEGSRGKYADDL